jgi:hypothetical protein
MIVLEAVRHAASTTFPGKRTGILYDVDCGLASLSEDLMQV